jgi:hypothetical protein
MKKLADFMILVGDVWLRHKSLGATEICSP